MRIVLFCHSMLSDWNHGNAHFLRGVATELAVRGHDVRVFEPKDGWSRLNMLADAGPSAIAGFHRAYPLLAPVQYDPPAPDLDLALDGADVVIVHEWSDAALVERLGRRRARGGRFVLLFHDTHHRSVSDPAAVSSYDLQHYDGVLAFGEVIRERYLKRGWARRAFTWHEAADVRSFTPAARTGDVDGDLVWIGNWGDDERSEEIRQYLIRPSADLGLRSQVHGVRYPDAAKRELQAAGIAYRGWLPNYRVPAVFARFAVTVHIPRRPYVEALPGIPTIRMFEALACGIPLVSCWWPDVEGLFEADSDFVMVRSPNEMRRAFRMLLNDRERARALAAHGLDTILARHTCGHRVSQLLGIVDALSPPAREAMPA